MNVGRSTDTVRLSASVWLSPTSESLLICGTSSIHVNSTPQFVLVWSSEKSDERPSTFRCWYSSVSSPPLCQMKVRRPKRLLPPANAVLRVTPAAEKKPFTLLQYIGEAIEQRPAV